ncbi:hypothetical protein F5879DRAFT_927585 [Lentinula edodes]|nr:hypothetical protein F5879DRAFT_927585 [Lentinula edodes]
MALNEEREPPELSVRDLKSALLEGYPMDDDFAPQTSSYSPRLDSVLRFCSLSARRSGKHESIENLTKTIETDSNDVRDSEEQKMVSVVEQVQGGELQLDKHQVQMAGLIEASQTNLAQEMARAMEALPSLPDWKIHFLNVLLSKGTHAEVTRMLAMNIFAPEQILPCDVQDPSKIIESLRESLRNEESVDPADTLVDRLELYRASQRSSIVMLERFLQSVVELLKD